MASIDDSTFAKDTEKALIKMYNRMHILERRTPCNKG